MNGALLEVENLSVHFAAPGAWWRPANAPVKAVQEVSFNVAPRQIVGLVGESGSGKSTLARAILRLIPASAGSVRFDGQELLTLDQRALKRVRRGLQVVFQDPYASLNPRMSAGENIAEGLLLHGEPRNRIPGAVADLLRQVGLPADAATRYPREFSGGQRQRIGIARALAVQPCLLVADEPVSALDMSIQAQILNLLLDQQAQRGLAMLFIGHDLSVVRHFCDSILVLYLGRVIERGPTEALFRHARHPYTRALIDAAPVRHPSKRRQRTVLTGEAPRRDTGCAFASRCLYVLPACHEAPPPLRPVGAEQYVACIRDDIG